MEIDSEQEEKYLKYISVLAIIEQAQPLIYVSLQNVDDHVDPPPVNLRERLLKVNTTRKYDE